MSDLWALGIPAVDKVIRTLLVYAGLALLLRLAGKRNLAQLDSFDLVVVLLLSNVVQNAQIGADNSLTGALIGAVVLLALDARFVRIIHRFDSAVRLFEGTDLALVKDGQFVDRSLRRQGLRRGDIETALRAQGADGPMDVAEATLSRRDSLASRLDRTGPHQRQLSTWLDGGSEPEPRQTDLIHQTQPVRK